MKPSPASVKPSPASAKPSLASVKPSPASVKPSRASVEPSRASVEPNPPAKLGFAVLALDGAGGFGLGLVWDPPENPILEAVKNSLENLFKTS